MTDDEPTPIDLIAAILLGEHSCVPPDESTATAASAPTSRADTVPASPRKRTRSAANRGKTAEEDPMIRYLLLLSLCACSTVHETEPLPCDVAPADISLPSGCYEDEPACEPSWDATPPDLLPCVRHYYCGTGSCVTAFDCECVAEAQAECGVPLPVACGGV